jgi:hypothetical protein
VALVLDRNIDQAIAHMVQHLMITVDALREAHFWEHDAPTTG